MATNNKKLVEELFNEGMNGGNVKIYDKLIAPEFANHGIPNAKKGPEGFKEIMQQFKSAFPDMKITAEHFVAEGDLVATRGYWTGTHKGSFMNMPASNKKVRVDYVDFWKINNGKFTESWVQMDMPGLWQQMSGQAQGTQH